GADCNSSTPNGLTNAVIISPVHSNRVYVASREFFGGQVIFKANQNISAKLVEVDRLMNTETNSHSYKHCWRHKSPHIYLPTAHCYERM
ncbi:hypothetical protein, partial [Pseudomonas syringae group genomosp. 7]|uniref:hypothetical protein n=1 Tax=Pseudomonas syringae group genomosp. 7 TaxID=251699 RepID=UPI003770085A